MPNPLRSLCAFAALTLWSSAALAERIYKWVDEDGVLHVTNIPHEARGHRGKPQADPEFKKLVPGPAAPLDFLPNDQTAQYDVDIRDACAKFHVPPALVRAIMNAESNFDPRAMSEKGAIGLMQLMPGTGDEMGLANVHDPHENIMGGVRYLRVLANTFDGDMVKVVAAYNAGPRAVIAAGGVPQIPETQDYVQKVLKLYFRYKSASGTSASGSETVSAP